MRVALYFLAALTVLPYALPSAGFVLLGQTTSGGTRFAFCEVLLTAAVWLVVILYLAAPESHVPQLLFVLSCALVMVFGDRHALSGFRGRRQITA